MSSNKKRRELNRAIEEHDKIKLSAQFAVGNHSMLNIAESILAKENAALKGQVAQLGIEFTVYKRATDLAYKGSELETQEQLTALQSKSAALVDASQLAADQIRVCDYTPARSTLLTALTAFKE